MIEIDANIVEIVTKGLFINSLDIFREYLQNSCDATDDAVEAGILQDGNGQIEIEIDKNDRRITIEDNGMGIPEEDLSRVFERFYRVDKARSRAAGGTGLGLSIVSDIVRRRGGTVEASNRFLGGAVFTVRWPVEEES